MIKQKLCGISRGIGFWLQNFAEFTKVEFASFFVWYFQGKVTKPRNSRDLFKKAYPQSPCLGFSGIAHVRSLGERAYINSTFHGKFNS